MKLYNEPPIFLGTDFGSNQGPVLGYIAICERLFGIMYRNFFLLTFESIFNSYHINSGRYFTSFNTFWLKVCFQSLFIILFIININFLFVLFLNFFLWLFQFFLWLFFSSWLFFISFYDFFNFFSWLFPFFSRLFFISFWGFFLFISMIFFHLFMTFSFLVMIFPYLFMI